MSDPKRTKPQRPYQEIECQFDEKTHYGKFYVWRGWLTLSCDVGHKSAPLNGSPPEVLAKMLLGELIADSERGSGKGPPRLSRGRW
jgi:hypothetical protein